MTTNSASSPRSTNSVVPAGENRAVAAGGQAGGISLPGEDNLIQGHWTPVPDRRRARRTKMRLLAMFLFSAVPAAVTAGYLWGFASDQYVSEFRFTVRQQSPARSDIPSLSSALGGGMSMLATVADSEIVVQYLKSRQAVDDIAPVADLGKIWGRPEADQVARLPDGATAEKKLRYWKRMVDPYFDMSSGVVTVQIRAFTPSDAKNLAGNALMLSERVVNDLSRRAHDDAITFSKKAADEAASHLRDTEAALASFRNRSKVLFPQMQAGAETGVEGKIMQSLSEAREQLSSLQASGVSSASPQVRILQTRISSLNTELNRSAAQLAEPSGIADEKQQSLATVVSGADAAETELRIAEKSYESALVNYQNAESTAAQQQVYLDAFVQPAEPQESGYPVRWRITLEVALAGFVTWLLGMLIIHGVKDHIS